MPHALTIVLRPLIWSTMFGRLKATGQGTPHRGSYVGGDQRSGSAWRRIGYQKRLGVRELESNPPLKKGPHVLDMQADKVQEGTFS